MPTSLQAPTPRVVRNTRHPVDRDTCGQAAVATVLATLRAGPFATHEPLDDARAIDLVRTAFPPDLGGLGTSAWRLATALRAHGVPAEVVHAGPFGLGAASVWERVRARLAHGLPVPVCLDDGLLGGTAWGAHWAVALAADGRGVTLGNVGPPSLLPLDRFMAAWRCRHLPWPYGYCAVLAGAPPPA